ncbi:MAG: purine-nucleoside phosphorylase [Acidobacteriota bacterium]
METLTPPMLEEAARRFASRHDPGTVRAAVVAGSGITLSAPGWEKATEVPYPEVFPFAISELPGHTPSLTVWRRGDDALLVFNGRFHLYQGYSVAQVAAIPRLAGLLGAPVYIATNASGAMDPKLIPGSLVVIRDHVNLQGVNALVGEWGRWRGPMFPDMTTAYDPDLRAAALRHAAGVGFHVSEGVYAGVLGPSYETPAEIEMLRRIGGTVVGMSTVQEVIAARHLGMRVLVLSLATNPAAGIAGRPLTHHEVIEAGEAARGRLVALLERLVAELVETAA